MYLLNTHKFIHSFHKYLLSTSNRLDMAPSTGEAEAKKKRKTKTPVGTEVIGLQEPDSKQVNALINQIIIDGNELGGYKQGNVLGRDGEGGFLL